MNTIEYKHLKPYERPSSYFGATWYGYYDVAGRNRDSDTLTNSNHVCWIKFLTELLGPADTVLSEEEEDVYNWTVCRESHWACGWIEIIRVRGSVGHEKLSKIDAQLQRLDDYPVFNEGHFSEAERCEYERCWYDLGADREFRRVVRRAFEKDAGDEPELPAMLDRFDELPIDKLIELHERLIPSGEYHYDCWPCIDISVEAMTWEDLEEVTK
jgi:hypothetical protein